MRYSIARNEVHHRSFYSLEIRISLFVHHIINTVRSVCNITICWRNIFQDRHFYETYDSALMATSSVFINTFSKNCFFKYNVKNPQYYLYWKPWSSLDSLGLRWWHHTIVKGLDEHCIATNVIGSIKTILTPNVQLCPPDPTIPFELCRRLFPIKIAFATTNSKAQGQTFKRIGIYRP